MARERLIYLIAGEPSGDAIGARLIEALRAAAEGEIAFAGLGGEAMAERGFESLFPIRELSVMGLIEVVPHARRILGRIGDVAEDIARLKPDLVVSIDSPAFTIRVMKRIADFGIPRVHVVAPTVWAWRPWRVHKFKRHYDHLLAILPFEPPFFERVGLTCSFIGHPVVEYGADQGDGTGFRARHGVGDDEKVLCLLPGSRRGEVTRHMPIFGETARALEADGQPVRCVIPTISSVRDIVRESVAEWTVPPIVVEGAQEKYDAMAASDIALAASGTVALELAIAEVPTVVGYQVNGLTAWMVRRLIKVNYVNIINILANSSLVPERLQQDCDPDLLTADLEALLGEDGRRQIDSIRPFVRQLRADERLPSEVAADYLLNCALQR